MAGVKLRVGALDAGLVFRADGTMEAMLPRVPPDRMPQNALIASALMWASCHPDVIERILDEMEAEPTETPSWAAPRDTR